MSRATRATLAVYLLVSEVCLAAKHQPIDPVVRVSWKWIWIVGPPIDLIHGLEYAWLYIGGSALVLGSIALARLTWVNRPAISLVCIGIAIVVWFVSGALVYAPEV